MKKIYLLFLVVIFSVFSCKSEPKKAKAADDPGLSQLELTAENEEAEPGVGFDDEPQADGTTSGETSADDKDALAQDDKTDGSVVAEAPDIEEKPSVVEAVQETKEPPKSETNKPAEDKPAAPAAKPAQPPVAVIKEDPSKAKAEEKPADDKKDAAEDAPTPPPTHRPPLTPPPAVTAVKDNAPIPNQRGLTVPPKEEEIIFSRVVNVMVGQLVEIPFRGSNWSYLENIASKRGVVYDSRRNDPEGMTFVFKAEEVGTYTLKFYRRDFIRDYILNDYVQVVVSESPNRSGNAGWFSPPADRIRVTAEPRWPSALEEASTLRGGARPASGAQGTPQAALQTSTPQSAQQAAAQQAAAPQTAPSQSAQQTASSQTSQQGTLQSAPQNSQQAAAQQAAAQQAAAQSSQPATQAFVIPGGTNASSQSAPPATQTVVIPQGASTPPPTSEAPAEKQEILPREEILKRAQDAFNAGKTPEAIALLDQYTDYYPGGDDELYWLYGQFYEASTPSRNILLSLDYYRRLVNEYPQSRRYNDARRRISYLERFYINIQ